MLIDEAKKQGKAFGLLFKDISGGFTFNGTFESAIIPGHADHGLPDIRRRTSGRTRTWSRSHRNPLTSFSKIVAAGDTPEVLTVLRRRIGIRAGCGGFAGDSHGSNRSAKESQIVRASSDPSAASRQHWRSAVRAFDSIEVWRLPFVCLLRLYAVSQTQHVLVGSCNAGDGRRTWPVRSRSCSSRISRSHISSNTSSLIRNATASPRRLARSPASDMNRARYLQAQVRVGDYDFDNSEFVTGGGFQGPPPAGRHDSDGHR